MTNNRYIYTLLFFFCLGWIVLSADQAIMYPLLDRIAEDMDLSATRTGTVASAYFIMVILTQVPIGLIGDRIGFKRLLVALYGLAGLALIALGLWTTNYITLLLFVALHGVGSGVYYPAVYSITMRTVPEKMRGLASALVNMGMAGGLGLGLVIAGFMFRLTGGWRMPFILAAIPTLSLAMIYFVLVREPVVVPSPRTAKPAWLSILQDRQLMGLYLAGFCSLYCFWVVVVWGPSFFQAERSMGLVGSGLYTALVTAVSIPAGLAMGNLSDRVGRRRLSWPMFLLTAGAVLVIATVNTPLAMILGLVMYGLVGKLAWDPIQISWMADHANRTRPHDLGLVMAMASIIGMSSSVIGPIISGWIRDLTGSLQGALYLGMALALVGAVISFRLQETVENPA